MNRDIFCSRKGGATIGSTSLGKGKFYPMERTSSILARQLEKYANKMEYRQNKRTCRTRYARG